MCEDLCLDMLGQSGCPNGSWCQNGFSCHSLFWTSASRTTVCLYAGESDCQDTIPVLCSEAAERLELQTPHPSLGTIDIINGRRVNADHRPYVRVEYMIQGEGMAFAALFDTATSQSLVPLVGELTVSSVYASAFDTPCFDPLSSIQVRPARTRQRYIDQNRAPVVHDSVPMNLGNNITETCRVIRERARLHSSFSSTFTFDTNVVLTSGRQPYHFLLGAGKDSEFARAAGVFAYSIDRLVIGEDAESICNQGPPIVWVPLFDVHDWVILGSMAFSDNPSHSRRINYVVDTAADRGYVVSSVMKNSIISMLVEQGAQVEASQTTLTNCTRDMIQSLPSLAYTLGSDGTADFRFSVSPQTYAEQRPDSVCELNLVEDDSTVVSLGRSMLQAFTTVFDNNNNRIGFCFTDYR
jgi:hypothetical protein